MLQEKMKPMMHKNHLPQDYSWNNFWSRKQSSQFKQISWSKRRILKILDPYLKKDVTVLDAGCGSGFFSKYFCDKGAKTTSLDYSQEALTITKELTGGRSRIIQQDLLSSDLSVVANQKFDIIFSDGLFEHFCLEDQDKILNNFKAVLANQGVVVTFVPNQWSPWELIRPFYMPGIEEKPFTLKKLVALNQRNDLTIAAKGGINVLPWMVSPEELLGPFFGMLLYTISTKNE